MLDDETRVGVTGSELITGSRDAFCTDDLSSMFLDYGVALLSARGKQRRYSEYRQLVAAFISRDRAELSLVISVKARAEGEEGKERER